MNSNQTSQQVLVITGGSRGIGAAVCRAAAARGYAIAMNYHSNQLAAQNLVNEITDSGGRIQAFPGDVAEESDVVRLFDNAESAFGRVTALVNNAGILQTQMDLADMTVERFDRVFAVNVRGSFLCAREAVRRMATSRGGNGGSIVNVSSAAARIGSPNEYIDYAASKGAIDSLTLGLSKEVGVEGIRVNAVRPGFIATDIHASGGDPGRLERIKTAIPLGRGGSAEEVANAILWLLSDESAYCTGSLLDISGGR